MLTLKTRIASRTSTITPGAPGLLSLGFWNDDLFWDDHDTYVDGTGDDTTPPFPNPPSFTAGPIASSSTVISMTCTPCLDLTPPIQYYFTEKTGNPGGADSGWLSDYSYTNSGLSPNTLYTYTCKTRDSAIPPNVSNESAPQSDTTSS